MAEKKKPKSVEDIINGYIGVKNKGFKERIQKFEEFHDTDNIHAQQLAQHAHYTVFGKPSDLKGYPGAHNEAYKVLDKHLSNDNDTFKPEDYDKRDADDQLKLDKAETDKLTEILEAYVDTFLDKAHPGYKAGIAREKEEGNLSDKDLRNLKGQIFGEYHRDEDGRPINILNDQYIARFKGKQKIELVAELEGLSEKVKESYVKHLHHKVLEGLVEEGDRIDLADYIRPIFKERGWKHKEDHVLRGAGIQAAHYGALLQGAGDQLRKQGYKVMKYEKKDDKK